MSKITILCIIVAVVKFADGYAQLGDTMNCADGDCSETVSEGKTKLTYQPSDRKFLNFRKGDVVLVKGKKAGLKTDLWGGQVLGSERFGFFPSAFIKEYMILHEKPTVLVNIKDFIGQTDGEEELSTLSTRDQKIMIQRRKLEENKKAVEIEKDDEQQKSEALVDKDMSESVNNQDNPHLVGAYQADETTDGIGQDLNSENDERKVDQDINASEGTLEEKDQPPASGFNQPDDKEHSETTNDSEENKILKLETMEKDVVSSENSSEQDEKTELDSNATSSQENDIDKTEANDEERSNTQMQPVEEPEPKISSESDTAHLASNLESKAAAQVVSDSIDQSNNRQGSETRIESTDQPQPDSDSSMKQNNQLEHPNTETMSNIQSEEDLTFNPDPMQQLILPDTHLQSENQQSPSNTVSGSNMHSDADTPSNSDIQLNSVARLEADSESEMQPELDSNTLPKSEVQSKFDTSTETTTVPILNPASFAEPEATRDHRALSESDPSSKQDTPSSSENQLELDTHHVAKTSAESDTQSQQDNSASPQRIETSTNSDTVADNSKSESNNQKESGYSSESNAHPKLSTPSESLNFPESNTPQESHNSEPHISSESNESTDSKTFPDGGSLSKSDAELDLNTTTDHIVQSDAKILSKEETAPIVDTEVNHPASSLEAKLESEPSAELANNAGSLLVNESGTSIEGADSVGEASDNKGNSFEEENTSSSEEKEQSDGNKELNVPDENLPSDSTVIEEPEKIPDSSKDRGGLIIDDQDNGDGNERIDGNMQAEREDRVKSDNEVKISDSKNENSELHQQTDDYDGVQDSHREGKETEPVLTEENSSSKTTEFDVDADIATTHLKTAVKHEKGIDGSIKEQNQMGELEGREAESSYIPKNKNGLLSDVQPPPFTDEEFESNKHQKAEDSKAVRVNNRPSDSSYNKTDLNVSVEPESKLTVGNVTHSLSSVEEIKGNSLQTSDYNDATQSNDSETPTGDNETQLGNNTSTTSDDAQSTLIGDEDQYSNNEVNEDKAQSSDHETQTSDGDNDEGTRTSDEAQLSDNETTPTDDETPPSDNEPTISDDAQSTPASDDKIQSDDKGTPNNDDKAQPKDEETLANDIEAQSSDIESRTSDDNSQSNDEETRTTGEEAQPSDNETPTTDNEAQPSDNETPTTDNEAQPSDNETPTNDNEAQPGDNETPTNDNEAQPGDNETTISDDAQLPTTSDDKAQSSDKELTNSDGAQLTATGDDKAHKTRTNDNEAQSNDEETRTNDEAQLSGNGTTTSDDEPIISDDAQSTSASDDKAQSDYKGTPPNNDDQSQPNDEETFADEVETQSSDNESRTSDDNSQSNDEETRTTVAEAQPSDNETPTIDKEVQSSDDKLTISDDAQLTATNHDKAHKTPTNDNEALLSDNETTISDDEAQPSDNEPTISDDAQSTPPSDDKAQSSDNGAPNNGDNAQSNDKETRTSDIEKQFTVEIQSSDDDVKSLPDKKSEDNTAAHHRSNEVVVTSKEDGDKIYSDMRVADANSNMADPIQSQVEDEKRTVPLEEVVATSSEENIEEKDKVTLNHEGESRNIYDKDDLMTSSKDSNMVESDPIRSNDVSGEATRKQQLAVSSESDNQPNDAIGMEAETVGENVDEKVAGNVLPGASGAESIPLTDEEKEMIMFRQTEARDIETGAVHGDNIETSNSNDEETMTTEESREKVSVNSEDEEMAETNHEHVELGSDLVDEKGAFSEASEESFVEPNVQLIAKSRESGSDVLSNQHDNRDEISPNRETIKTDEILASSSEADTNQDETVATEKVVVEHVNVEHDDRDSRQPQGEVQKDVGIFVEPHDGVSFAKPVGHDGAHPAENFDAEENDEESEENETTRQKMEELEKEILASINDDIQAAGKIYKDILDLKDRLISIVNEMKVLKFQIDKPSSKQIHHDAKDLKQRLLEAEDFLNDLKLKETIATVKREKGENIYSYIDKLESKFEEVEDNAFKLHKVRSEVMSLSLGIEKLGRTLKSEKSQAEQLVKTLLAEVEERKRKDDIILLATEREASIMQTKLKALENDVESHKDTDLNELKAEAFSVKVRLDDLAKEVTEKKQSEASINVLSVQEDVKLQERIFSLETELQRRKDHEKTMYAFQYEAATLKEKMFALDNEIKKAIDIKDAAMHERFSTLERELKERKTNESEALYNTQTKTGKILQKLSALEEKLKDDEGSSSDIAEVRHLKIEVQHLEMELANRFSSDLINVPMKREEELQQRIIRLEEELLKLTSREEDSSKDAQKTQAVLDRVKALESRLNAEEQAKTTKVNKDDILLAFKEATMEEEERGDDTLRELWNIMLSKQKCNVIEALKPDEESQDSVSPERSLEAADPVSQLHTTREAMLENLSSGDKAPDASDAEHSTAFPNKDAYDELHEGKVVNWDESFEKKEKKSTWDEELGDKNANEDQDVNATDTESEEVEEVEKEKETPTTEPILVAETTEIPPTAEPVPQTEASHTKIPEPTTESSMAASKETQTVIPDQREDEPAYEGVDHSRMLEEQIKEASLVDDTPRMTEDATYSALLSFAVLVSQLPYDVREVLTPIGLWWISLLPEEYHENVYGVSWSIIFLTSVLGIILIWIILWRSNAAKRIQKERGLVMHAEELHAQLEVLLGEKLETENSLTASENKVTEMYSKLDEMQILQTNAQEEIDQLKDELEILHHGNDEKTELCNQLNVNMKELEKNKTDILKVSKMTEKHLEEEKTAFFECEKSLAQVENELKETREEQHGLEESLKNLRKSLNKKEETEEEHNKRLREWEEQAEVMRTQINTLEEQLSIVKGEKAATLQEADVLKDCLLQFRGVQETLIEDGDEELENDELVDKQKEKLRSLIDVARIQTQVKQVETEKGRIIFQLEAEKKSREKTEARVGELEAESENIRAMQQKTERELQVQQAKLNVMQEFYAKREVEMQGKLGKEQTVREINESKLAQEGDRTSQLLDQLEMYKKMNEDAKREFDQSEKQRKNEINRYEKKAHDSWLASREAERKLEEANREMSQLRMELGALEQRLRDAESREPFVIRPRPIPPSGMFPDSRIGPNIESPIPMRNGPPFRDTSPPPGRYSGRRSPTGSMDDHVRHPDRPPSHSLSERRPPSQGPPIESLEYGDAPPRDRGMRRDTPRRGPPSMHEEPVRGGLVPRSGALPSERDAHFSPRRDEPPLFVRDGFPPPIRGGPPLSMRGGPPLPMRGGPLPMRGGPPLPMRDGPPPVVIRDGFPPLRGRPPFMRNGSSTSLGDDPVMLPGPPPRRSGPSPMLHDLPPHRDGIPPHMQEPSQGPLTSSPYMDHPVQSHPIRPPPMSLHGNLTSRSGKEYDLHPVRGGGVP